MFPEPLNRLDQVPNMLSGRFWVCTGSLQLFPDQTRSEPHKLLGVDASPFKVVRVELLEECWEIIYACERVGQKLRHNVQVALCLQRSMPVLTERIMVTNGTKRLSRGNQR